MCRALTDGASVPPAAEGSWTLCSRLTNCAHGAPENLANERMVDAAPSKTCAMHERDRFPAATHQQS